MCAARCGVAFEFEQSGIDKRAQRTVADRALMRALEKIHVGIGVAFQQQSAFVLR